MLGWFYLFSCLCVYVLKWCAVLCSCFGLMAIYLLAWAELGIAARAWGTLTRFFPLYLSIFITSNTNRFGWGLCVEARPLATVLTLCGAVGVLAPPFAYIDFKVWLMNACLFSTPTDPRRPRQRVVTAIHHTFTQLRVGSCRRLCLRSGGGQRMVVRLYGCTLPGGIWASISVLLVLLDLVLLGLFRIFDW